MATLANRKQVPPKPLPEDWYVSTTLSIDNRSQLTPGVELSIKRPGKHLLRCRFVRFVSTPRGEWVDVYDGKAVRSFPPTSIVTVHRSRKLAKREAE